VHIDRREKVSKLGGLTTNQQKAAVDYLLDNCVVTAGAGSGKTRVLTHRYVNLLAHHQQDPALLSQIVAITFTDKAATEMRERIRLEIEKRIAQAEEQCLSEEKLRWQELWAELGQARISTFHSFCQRLIQAHPQEAEVDPYFSILSEQEAYILLTEAIREVYLSVWSKEVNTKILEPWFVGNRLESIEKSLRQVMGKLHSLGWDFARLKHGSERSFFRQQEQVEMKLQQLKEEIKRQSTHSFAQQLLATAEQILNLNVKAASILTFQTYYKNWRLEWEQSQEAKEQEQLLKSLKKQVKGSWGKNKPWKDKLLEMIEQLKQQLLKRKSWEEQLFELESALNRLDEERELTMAIIQILQLIDQRYAAKKEERQVLDFDDLQEKAVRLLERDPAIRRRYQKQIRYLLVDEYQDTNHIQKRLIDLLCKDEHGRIPNGKLFVVGDPKQSIYRFRGADVSLFTKVQQEIENSEGKLVALDTNFRSDPTLIDFYNHIFPQLMTEEKHHPNSYQPVLSRERIDPPRCVIDWIAVPTKEDLPEGWTKEKIEAMMIAHHIKQLCNEGYSPKDITILMRTMPQVKIYEQALLAANIPFRVIGGRGFYERQEVIDLLHFLQILVDPSHRLAWAGVLRSPFCGISDETLLRISLADQWQGGIDQWMALLGLPRSEKEKLKQFASTFESIQRCLGQMPVSQLMERILEESGYLEVLATLPNYPQMVANVRKLIHQSRGLSGSARYSVRAYLDWIEQIQRSDKEETEAAIELEDSDSVQIMTIHQSKGLEFPVVYLPRLGSRTRSSDSLILVDEEEGMVVQMKNRAGEEIETERWKTVSEKEKRLDWEESVRLFYVATTRAEQRLVLSGPEDQVEKTIPLHNIKNWSKWLDVVLGYERIDQEKQIWPFAEGCMPIRVFRQFSTDEEEENSSSNHPLLDQYLAGKLVPRQPIVEPALLQPCSLREIDLIELSVTDWKQLVNCPRKYYYKRVIGIPEMDDERVVKREESTPTFRLAPTIKGQMVHLLCEWMMEPNQDIIDLEKLWHRLWSVFQVIPEQQERVKRELTPYLNNFIQSELFQQKAKWKSIEREWGFTEQIQGLLISGQIDLLCEDHQGHWYLYDYKTDWIGNNSIKQKAEEYKPQLQLYVLALKRRFGRAPEQATLYFLEPNLCYTFHITKDWLLLAEESLLKTGKLLRSNEIDHWSCNRGTHCDSCFYRFICENES
jgi:ATP-dependent helicase/nuclease subunit A